MANVECIFCHEQIPEQEIEAHCAAHRADRGDGQQRDYATLSTDQRVRFDLTGVSQVYRHLKCEVATGMPVDIVRTYLADPWFYKSDQTYCCGCSEHVPIHECVWTETGENLQHYMDELRENHDRAKQRRLDAALEALKNRPSIFTWQRFWATVVLVLYGFVAVNAYYGNGPSFGWGGGGGGRSLRGGSHHSGSHGHGHSGGGHSGGGGHGGIH